jgi:hypothetical protein
MVSSNSSCVAASATWATNRVRAPRPLCLNSESLTSHLRRGVADRYARLAADKLAVEPLADVPAALEALATRAAATTNNSAD